MGPPAALGPRPPANHRLPSDHAARPPRSGPGRGAPTRPAGFPRGAAGEGSGRAAWVRPGEESRELCRYEAVPPQADSQEKRPSRRYG